MGLKTIIIMKNVKQITLIITEMGLKMFKTIPTYKNLLHDSQLKALVVGENTLSVNHYIFSRLKTVSGYSNGNISVK